MDELLGGVLGVLFFWTGELVLRVASFGLLRSPPDHRSATARELWSEVRTWVGAITWLALLGTIGRMFDL